MAKIAILIDSTASLPKEWVEQFRIETIPLKIQWGADSYLDGVDLSSSEFYRRLYRNKVLPTTSQPSLEDFLLVFEKLSKSADGIVAPLISTGISGTVNTALEAAKEFPGLPIKIIDTRITSMGQSQIVLAIARALAAGRSLEEACQVADRIINTLHTYFAVDSLEYLHKGGRINRASRFFGAALDIKPILYFNEEGKIDALERVRTKKRALQRLLSLSTEYAGDAPVRVGLAHSNALEVLEEFTHEIKQQLNVIEVVPVELSPVVGVHVGPGTIGISLYKEFES